MEPDEWRRWRLRAAGFVAVTLPAAACALFGQSAQADSHCTTWNASV
jgi:hypothetical protein